MYRVPYRAKVFCGIISSVLLARFIPRSPILRSAFSLKPITTTIMAPTNHAAWQKEKGGPVFVEPSAYPTLLPNEVIMKVSAVAINPVDWGIMTMNFFNSAYPKVTGHDGAGTVAAVGPGVTHLKEGDRIFAFPQESKGFEYATHQEYCKVCVPTIGKTPDNISDAQASTISLGFGTAACGLFGKKHLALEYPPADGSRASSKGQTVIIWGGSSSVGAGGVQAAVAAGYDVISTASPKNHDLVKSIGASHVFDYKSESVVEDILAAVKGKELVGALSAVADEQSIKALSKVLVGADAKKKYIGSVYPGLDKFAAEGVTVAFVLGTALRDEAEFELGKRLWQEYLPAAISNGNFKIVPEAKVVAKGLGSIMEGIAAWKAGVSAEKIVVEL